MNLLTKSVRGAGAIVCAFGLAAAARADVLVSNFQSSTITDHALATGTNIGTYGAGSGLFHPLCARIGPDGKLYVTSEGTNAVLRFNPATGAFIDTFIAPGAGGLTQPTGLDWGPDGNLYVASFDGDSVLKFSALNGAPMGTFVSAGSGGLNGADNGTCFGPDGNLYVPSYFTNRVLRYDGATGAPLGLAADILRPRVMLFRNGEMLVTSETFGDVERFDLVSGDYLGSLVVDHLNVPIGMAFGGDGTLLVASSGTNTVVQFDATSGVYIRDFATSAQGIHLPAFITIVPQGSCCAASGVCTTTAQLLCADAWTGGAACDPNPCPQPGACCTGTACAVTPAGGCGGAFQGGGSACGTAGNPTTCCPANFNQTGGVTVQDLFDFLVAWFAHLPSADFNHAGGVTPQDLFDYLVAWFAKC